MPKYLEYYRGRKLFLLRDIILILVAIATISVLFLAFSTDAGSYAEIYCEGRLVARYDLSVDAVYEIDCEYGMTIAIANGGISVHESGCKTEQCKHSAAISAAGQVIVCAPNRVVIKISGKPPVDAVTG